VHGGRAILGEIQGIRRKARRTGMMNTGQGDAKGKLLGFLEAIV